MARRRRLLFLSHAASRNGASVLLLHLLQWLRQNADFELEVACQGGGPLLPDFRDVARTHVAPAAAWPRAGEPRWRAAVRERVVSPTLRAGMAGRPDLVYANTAAAWNQVATLARPDVPLLWHIHELPYALKLLLPTPAAAAWLGRATRVVAVSEAVREALVRDQGIARGIVDVVNGFVPPPSLSGAPAAARRRELRATLGWSADDVVVGGCGGPGWRKGTDLFLQAAREAVRSAVAMGAPRMRFLWVGGDPASVEALQFDHEVRALGLADTCARVPSNGDMDAWYATMDLFALPSREDPFPLVMLEAAGHGLPTVCFDEAGGGVEFARQGGGLVVPPLDATALGRVLAELAADPARRRALGDAAREHVSRQHRLEVQAPRLLRSLEACLTEPRPSLARMAWR